MGLAKAIKVMCAPARVEMELDPTSKPVRVGDLLAVGKDGKVKKTTRFSAKVVGIAVEACKNSDVIMEVFGSGSMYSPPPNGSLRVFDKERT